MTESDAGTAPSSLVPGAHRVVRSIDFSEAPLPGTLVTAGDDVAIRIDAADLVNWGGWAYSGAEHVCGVVDMVRRADGHDALLPWCTSTVAAFLGRRLAAEAPLSAGELGTLAVSVLRGVRELEAGGATVAEEAVGDWWLTSQGRPLFIHGEGGAARARSAGLIDRLAAHSADRATLRVLEEVAAALRERRHHEDQDERWETQLFEIAAPRPLRLDVFAAERVSELTQVGALRRDAATDLPKRRRRTETQSSVLQIGFGAARAAIELLRERLRMLWSRVRRYKAGDGETVAPRVPKTRRRALVLAACLAGAVLIGGLMWPDGDAAAPADAAARIPDGEVPSPAVAEPSQAPPAETSDTHPDDVLESVPALLEAAEACAAAGASECPEALLPDVVMPSGGLIASGASASTAELLDDYGDVAVVKLTAADAETSLPAQMMVVERQEKAWLVRDVYDVANQPG